MIEYHNCTVFYTHAYYAHDSMAVNTAAAVTSAVLSFACSVCTYDSKMSHRVDFSILLSYLETHDYCYTFLALYVLFATLRVDVSKLTLSIQSRLT